MPEVYVLIPLAGMATGAVFMIVAYKLGAKWMDLRHRQRGPSLSEDEVRQLEERVALLEDQVIRIQEVEERLDFAERLLAKDGQRPLLGDH